MIAGIVLIVAMGLVPGCGGDQSAQWLETAQFEERQQNLPHAKELYEDIIREYPDSPAAVTARERLAAPSSQPDAQGSSNTDPIGALRLHSSLASQAGIDTDSLVLPEFSYEKTGWVSGRPRIKR